MKKTLAIIAVAFLLAFGLSTSDGTAYAQENPPPGNADGGVDVPPCTVDDPTCNP